MTTDVPGGRDAVAGIGTGLLIPPRDSMALVDALKALWIDPAVRHEMGRLGRELVVERFSQKSISVSIRDVLMPI